MIINLDQTPSKFVPGCNKTLAKNFVISANKKHSNDREALNMLENVIIPYVEKQYASLYLDFDHPAFLSYTLTETILMFL